jgi:HAD superfamily hydrolase (TIGR01509 family)
MIDWQHIDTIFLDMDGTLLDLHFDNYFWLEYLPVEYAKTHNKAIEEVRVQLLQMMDEAHGSIDWYCIDYWTDKLGLDIMSLKKEVEHLIQLRPAAGEFLDAAHRSSKAVYLITNAHHNILDLKLEKIKISHYFDQLISSHQYGYIKEQQEFWQQLQKDVSFDPKRTLFIDDSIAVLDSAAKYGIENILCISKPDSKKQPNTSSNYPMLDNFSDIMKDLNSAQ